MTDVYMAVIWFHLHLAMTLCLSFALPPDRSHQSGRLLKDLDRRECFHPSRLIGLAAVKQDYRSAMNAQTEYLSQALIRLPMLSDLKVQSLHSQGSSESQRCQSHAWSKGSQALRELA